MSDLKDRLKSRADRISLGEHIAWGSDRGLMIEAAERIEQLEARNEKLEAEVTNWKISMGTAIEERDETNAELEAENARLTGISESKSACIAEMLKKESAIKEALILAWAEAFWRADVSNNDKYDARCRAELRYLVKFGE